LGTIQSATLANTEISSLGIIIIFFNKMENQKREHIEVMTAVGDFVKEKRICSCTSIFEGSTAIDGEGFHSSSFQTRVKESWRELKDHPGYYICQHGFVLSTKKRQVKVLSTFYNKYTKVLSVSFGRKTRSVAKLVLETFDPEFQSTGGTPRFKNMDHRDVRLSNLTYDAYEGPEERDYWASYHKVRWNSPQGVPEHLAKAFFSYVLDNTSVRRFCKEYNKIISLPKQNLKTCLKKGLLEGMT
jgi:hypothetical protein